MSRRYIDHETALGLKSGDEKAYPATIMQNMLLIVSATETECSPTLKKTERCKNLSSCLYSGYIQGKPVEILISGIGAVATTFRLTQTLMRRPYSRVISIGIAGSYAPDVPVGDVVQITEDRFADLGIDDNGSFLSLREAGITVSCDDDADGLMTNPSPALSPHPVVRGITVQTASGRREQIDQLVDRFHPQVETMENAAFFYVCRMMQVPFASFRAISNRVEARNRASWRITEAVESVNEALASLSLTMT
jgi:futalosine hydrolase